jgi:L-threonylcarbamoyladenylate synthase
MIIGSDISKAKHILERGGLVAIPTETVYGLAANAFSDSAILKVYKAKDRPSFNPLIVHVKSIDAVDEIAEMPPVLKELANHFWPGPLTLLVPKKEKISYLVTAGSDMVAIRMPNHRLTLDLLSSLTFPLVGPSANPFGYVSPTNAIHVKEGLGTKVDYILDGGQSEIGLESTIVSLRDNTVVVHRLGAITIAQVKSLSKLEVISNIQNNSNPVAPGMLDKHYAPICKLHLYNEKSDINEPNIGLIWFGENTPKDLNESVHLLNLSFTGSLEEAARNLFGILRQLDALKLKHAYIKTVPNRGIGMAINDRINRAIVH